VTLASVTQLSPATRAIIAFHGSGKVLSLTFVRGREAFALDDREAQKLADVLLAERPRVAE
jgi:hypothetical protein